MSHDAHACGYEQERQIGKQNARRRANGIDQVVLQQEGEKHEHHAEDRAGNRQAEKAGDELACNLKQQNERD